MMKTSILSLILTIAIRKNCVDGKKISKFKYSDDIEANHVADIFEKDGAMVNSSKKLLIIVCEADL